MTAREDYLKAILVLKNRLGEVHSVDVASYLGVSKPSVSHAVSVLTSEGYLTVDGKYVLHLTEQGQELAERIYERHCFFTEQLMAIGVNQKTAEEDACRLEHAISRESFEKLKEAVAANPLKRPEETDGETARETDQESD